jgi:hypothetical protein
VWLTEENTACLQRQKEEEETKDWSTIDEHSESHRWNWFSWKWRCAAKSNFFFFFFFPDRNLSPFQICALCSLVLNMLDWLTPILLSFKPKMVSMQSKTTCSGSIYFFFFHFIFLTFSFSFFSLQQRADLPNGFVQLF